jgi:hypothetical protein
MANQALLTNPELTIIFATSPTGLGHLRVTDALYHGLTPASDPVLLGAQDPSVSAMYRFISIHPLTRNIMEVLQMPPFDKPFAAFGRVVLRSQTKLLYQQLKTILSERFTVSKTVLLVASHAILGHQLGAIKDKLARELGISLLLVVQITDDSPQPIWYVPEADLIFAPSPYTKEHLVAYAKKANLKQTKVVVAAYPISPLLTESLSEQSYEKRLAQVDSEGKRAIQMSVPVSGAAVGTTFLTDYIQALHEVSDRFVFHVVSREAPFTQAFIESVKPLPFVKLYTSSHDRTTLHNYENVYKEVPIALEITKPSEQSFKALASPKQRGGAILLFSNPVGGQEYDNLHFLRNHGLMPGKAAGEDLWQKAKRQESLQGSEYLVKAHHWRSILLPLDPKEASAFTAWCLKEKLFTTMMQYKKDEDKPELQSNGVEQFWSKVEELLIAQPQLP